MLSIRCNSRIKLYIYIYIAYVSKHNKTHEKQLILLMISNGEQRKAKSDGCEVKSEGR